MNLQNRSTVTLAVWELCQDPYARGTQPALTGVIRRAWPDDFQRHASCLSRTV